MSAAVLLVLAAAALTGLGVVYVLGLLREKEPLPPLYEHTVTGEQCVVLGSSAVDVSWRTALVQGPVQVLLVMDIRTGELAVFEELHFEEAFRTVGVGDAASQG